MSLRDSELHQVTREVVRGMEGTIPHGARYVLVLLEPAGDGDINRIMVSNLSPGDGELIAQVLYWMAEKMAGQDDEGETWRESRYDA